MSLKVSNLRKSFSQGENQLEILKGLELLVEEGQSVAIIGRSGSGKSTLLSLLAGLDTPDSGEIVINNQDYSKLSLPERTRFRGENLGIVFQSFYLLNYLTAFENVSLPLDILGRKVDQKHIEKLLHSLGLEGRFHHKPTQLSGGECQRVAIARALISQPKFILADEPTGNLDEDTGEIVITELLRVAKEHRVGLILVTHSMDMAHRCDKIMQLKMGVLQNVET